MTQREIDKRTGLKGRTRQFTFPVSESSFSGDRVMFNDTGSVRLDYSFDNKNGVPTIDTDMVNLGSANQRYNIETEHFVFSDKSLESDEYNEFQPNINPGQTIQRSKFGNGSLSVKDDETNTGDYSQTGNQYGDGIFELFVFLESLPSSGNYYGLLITGGETEGSNRQYRKVFGIDSDGDLIQSNFGGTNTGVVSSVASEVFKVGKWHHILLGQDYATNTRRYVYIDGDKKFDASGIQFQNLITDSGYQIGADVSGEINSVTYTKLDGYIDEFRVQVGSRETLTNPRLSNPGLNTKIDIPTESFTPTSNDAVLLQFDGNSIDANNNLIEKYRIKNGTLRVFINGIEQLSNVDQTQSASADIFIDESQQFVRVNKLTFDNFGMELKSGSVISDADPNFLPPTTTGDGSESSIKISFQKEVSIWH